MHSVGDQPSGADDVRIVLMTDERIPETKALVDRVFPSQDPAERLFFWAYARRGTWLSKAAFWISRIAEVDRIWVAVDEADALIGTTGLYRYRRDAYEAVFSHARQYGHGYWMNNINALIEEHPTSVESSARQGISTEEAMAVIREANRRASTASLQAS